MTADDINELRQDVDRIDSAIIDLLAQRRRVSLAMAGAKHDAGRPFYDHERERALSEARLKAADELDVDASLVGRLWREIIDDSLRLQHEYLQHEINTGVYVLVGWIRNSIIEYHAVHSGCFHQVSNSLGDSGTGNTFISYN